jgi:hypothetical protein
LQDHVAGHLKEEIADEEDAGAHAVNRIAHPQVLLHLELGEAYVNAIDVRQNVAEKQEGHQPLHDFAVRSGFEGFVGQNSRGVHIEV